MEIPKKLKDEIWEYCRMNDIPNIDEFIIKMVRQGYTVEKFGATPLGTGEVKEVEKIVEVVKEVPVEKIVEVIKELPIEVIKEVIVEKPIDRVIEKEIYITDDDQVNELGGKIANLEENIFQLNEELEIERKIFSTKTEEMENFFQKEMSKKNEELDELRRSLDIYLDISKEENEKIKEGNRKISDLTDKISQLESEVLNLNKELEEEKKKNKKGDDLYGEEKRGGWFGSNLLNRK